MAARLEAGWRTGVHADGERCSRSTTGYPTATPARAERIRKRADESCVAGVLHCAGHRLKGGVQVIAARGRELAGTRAVGYRVDRGNDVGVRWVAAEVKTDGSAAARCRAAVGQNASRLPVCAPSGAIQIAVAIASSIDAIRRIPDFMPASTEQAGRIAAALSLVVHNIVEVDAMRSHIWPTSRSGRAEASKFDMDACTRTNTVG